MSFVANSLVVLRESLEAFLIVGILAGLVTKIGRPGQRRTVYLGAATGVGASIVLGIILLSLAEGLRATSEELVAGIASILAAAVLAYMVVWMYRHSKELMGNMHGRLRQAIGSGTHAALFWLPLVAVVREGLETVLFLAASGDTSTLSLIGAVVLGVATAVVLGFLLFSGVVRLSIEKFMAWTGALLVVFGAWILRYGVHEMGEVVGNGFLEHLGADLAGLAYLLGFGIWYLRPIVRRMGRRNGEAASEPVEP